MSEATNVVDTPEVRDAFQTDVPASVETLVTPVQQKDAVTGKSFTEEDIRRARETEKSKLYPQIDSLKEEVSLLKKEREERQAEAERFRAEQEAEIGRAHV